MVLAIVAQTTWHLVIQRKKKASFCQNSLRTQFKIAANMGIAN